MIPPKTNIGERYHRWLVIDIAPSSKFCRRYLCRCDCGVERIVDGPNLRNGSSKSCGCLMKEVNSERGHARREKNEELFRQGLKNCNRSKCKQTNPQPLSAFVKDRAMRDGLNQHCRSCDRAVMVQTNYGMTEDEYDALVEAQGGVCAICKNGQHRTLHGKVTTLDVDHCHDTKQVRGLLCTNCNNGIGRFMHDPDLLEQAAVYLRSQQTVMSGG